MTRVIVAGSRGFTDYAYLEDLLDLTFSLNNYPDISIVSGTARGVDRLGEEYAENRGYPVVRYPADWEAHGRAAGHIRNRLMADNAEVLVAFWDEKSRGTEGMIKAARERNLDVFVYTV